ncbi:hypothetical protein BHE74_00017971 [Ensete ventricosum]|nr:hypothetical protein BHE74_00017971 [Ensete ventricosum]
MLCRPKTQSKGAVRCCRSGTRGSSQSLVQTEVRSVTGNGGDPPAHAEVRSTMGKGGPHGDGRRQWGGVRGGKGLSTWQERGCLIDRVSKPVLSAVLRRPRFRDTFPSVNRSDGGLRRSEAPSNLVRRFYPGTSCRRFYISSAGRAAPDGNPRFRLYLTWCLR